MTHSDAFLRPLFAVVRTPLTIVLLALAAVLPAHAQSSPEAVTLDPSLRLTQYAHRTWFVDDGLPQNSIDAMEQTRDGYLWLGTEEGLARFDGVRFETFDKRRVDALRTNAVVALHEHADGTLWIGTRDGLLAYADDAFTAYTTDDGLGSNSIMYLTSTRDGALWVGTYGGGLSRRHEGTFTTFGADEGLPGIFVTSVHEDGEGTLWAGTDAGLFRREGEAFVPAALPGLPAGPIRALYADRRDRLWIGTRDAGLHRWNGRSLTSFDDEAAFSDGYVHAMVQDRAGSLWFGTSGQGLVRYYGGRFEAYSQAEGLSNDKVPALLEGREGSLWVGTMHGMNQLRTGKFVPFTPQEGLSDHNAYTVYEDAAGTVWVGTSSGLDHIIDGDVAPVPALAGEEILAVGGTPDGAVWAGTYAGGLVRLHRGEARRFTVDNGLPSDVVFALFTDRRGHLWVGTDAGAARYDGSSFHPITSDDGLSSNFITAFAEDPDGGFWIGTYDRGVNHISEDGSVEAFTSAEGLSNDGVLSLYADPEGVLWIGTFGGGLNRLEGDSLTALTSREGLFNDNVYTILPDDDGNLWMTCNRGIFRVRRAALDEFAAGLRTSVTSTVYGKADGLKSVEANGGQQPAGWRGSDGRLWFPTRAGAVVFDPAHVHRNLLPPPVHIEALTSNDRSYAVTPDVTLAAGSRRVALRYTAPSLTAPEQIRFRVKLDGVDQEWMDVGARREAQFTNLGPGSYTFRVQARNSDGVWNRAGSALSFSIAPFFYQTYWFLALCVLALIGTAAGGYRLRVRHLHARKRELERVVEERTHDLRLEKERTEKSKAVIEEQAERLRELDSFKTQFFANVSHEIRTPLTMIIGPLENMLHGRYGELPDTLRSQGEIMLRSALRLLRLINQLLDLSKLEDSKMRLRARRGNLTALVEGIVQTCTTFADQRGVTLHFESEVEEAPLYYEPDKLEKVFYNLLSNALKFTPGDGTITVTLEETPPDEAMPEGGVAIRIEDTGRGIPASHLPHVFDRYHQVEDPNTREHEGTGIGLSLVRELVLLHHGTIEVESEEERGTAFTVVLPQGSSHLTAEERAEAHDAEAAPEHNALAELASSAFDFDEGAPAKASGGDGAPADADAPLILVVDDNHDVCRYVASLLEDTYRVATAHDGRAGLEQTRALRPDLILSDVMMPVMDGNALCRSVKQDPDLRHVPVVLLTARATHATRLEGLTAGADDYLAKPFNARELRIRIENLLRLRRQEKELAILNEHLAAKVQEQVELMLRERRAYEHELIEARDAAEASSRLKSTILNNMHHEFRTPITTIQGYAQIMGADGPEEFREFAHYIEEGSRRLMHTLEAVLELGRLESDDVALSTEPRDLRTLAREMHETFLRRAEQKGLALHLDEPATPVVADVDPAALRHVLQHVVDNAVKFTDEGEVTVRVAREGNHAVIEVCDTGSGIHEDFLPHLFEAFSQESTGLARSHEGTGLGLTIAHRLTELMDGALTPRSTPKEGSTFTLSFPVTSEEHTRTMA